MFFQLTCCTATLQNCKKYCACVLILTCFLILFQSHQYFLITKKKSDLPLVKMIETDSSLSGPMIYQHRSRALIGKCSDAHTSLYDLRNDSPTSLISAYPWLNSAIFPLQSKSLMYCAVPKVASKTLISLMMYAYVRDITDYLNNNSTDTNANKTRIKQRINIPKLVEQLRKVCHHFDRSQCFIPIFRSEWNSNSKYKRADCFCLVATDVSSYTSIRKYQ